ncbi:(5-formylfuran-3-yl)methyl phosphate synthase [Mariniblastus fucicola]|uniref:(5-formylfuran-3-yl)methyl phosphate synthase n=1 Tax=Mariniblastus fucicola TaxID=980251 RepID=A0A5B9PFK2_9BACT|nr:(5-formylfuran-3-yl)methyl phosphate synthase [Mariniblastus fucicola]QEG21731.1 hypothetical protein MFFC18_15900 [Mariniblastus fucicola]
MNHTHSARKNTVGLLVSVRSLREAAVAESAQCVTIIDLKEPEHGSLGCVSIEVANAVLDDLSGDSLKSIALGEAKDWPVWPQVDAAIRNQVLAGFDFAKVGLSGLVDQPDWVSRWKICFAGLPDRVQRVAVAYADEDLAQSPSIESVIEAAEEVGCNVLLIDTFNKQHGGLLKLLTEQRLASIIQSAKKRKLKVVLAGSLTHEDVAAIRQLSPSLVPDLIAVRGAVCQHDRSSAIDATKIEALGSLLSSQS